MQTAMISSPSSPSPGREEIPGGVLVSTDGRLLPLRKTGLEVQAQGGIARVLLQQTFVNESPQPLLVHYQLPLPVNGAVSGFRFHLEGRTIAGRVDAKQKARKRFAEAMVRGQTAALLEQQRPDQFRQQVGNIPPGAELRCEVEVDQKLQWLAEGAWEWRFPTVIGPRYMGQAGRVEDAKGLQVPASKKPLPTRAQLSMVVQDALASRPHAIHSPSHGLQLTRAGSMCRVEFAEEEGSRLDRDVVIRWQVAAPDVGVSLHVARPAGDEASAAYGLLSLVPPEPEAAIQPLPRDLIFLIDTSGSMAGWPLKQSIRLLCAMIDSLSEDDRLEMIEFSSQPQRWKPEAVAATGPEKAEAKRWLGELRAGGCTEMRDAIFEALRPLRPDAMRQIALVTDGYIGFENEILQAVHQDLPARSRLHCIGVGSAVNRGLTEAAARAGAGEEILLDAHEDVAPAVARLLSRTTAPLLTELSIRGDAVLQTVPARLPDLYADSPALLSAKLRATGGSLEVSGEMAGRPFSQVLAVPAAAPGQGEASITALFGREQLADLETWRATVDLTHPRSRDTLAEIDASVEAIGLGFQLATRLTSWIAVDDEVSVDPHRPKRLETMPHELPHSTSIEGLGLRPPSPQLLPAGSLIPAQELDGRAASFAVDIDSLLAADIESDAPALLSQDLWMEDGEFDEEQSQPLQRAPETISALFGGEFDDDEEESTVLRADPFLLDEASYRPASTRSPHVLGGGEEAPGSSFDEPAPQGPAFGSFSASSEEPERALGPRDEEPMFPEEMQHFAGTYKASSRRSAFWPVLLGVVLALLAMALLWWLL